MRNFILYILFIILIVPVSCTNPHKIPVWQDNSFSFEERVNDLISNMTPQQKISQMLYDAPAIESLGIPSYNWWNEGLHGVARAGKATVFPQAIGLAATWDKELMFLVATAISDEARAKYNDFQRKGKRGIYQGLTFWSPNINIFRDPRWGRGMETYGEDPVLTGLMAVQFVKGMQGNHPKYLKTVATSKHFAVHSGPEPDRHSFNAKVDNIDLFDTYLPAFEMTVKQADVQSVMCAYNSFRGDPCCGNNPLLQQILRDKWGFNGYVVSDCWAIMDFYNGHNITKDTAEAAAIALKSGTDLNCGISFRYLKKSLEKGFIEESDIDRAAKRLFLARFKLGMFDPPGSNPYDSIPISILDSRQHLELAREAACKSIVLLKNENNLLPLSKNLKIIAVIGPNANDAEVLLGNYNGTPSNPVTPLQGIRNKLPGCNVQYALGCPHAENLPSLETIPSEYLFTDESGKEKGLKGEYFNNKDLAGVAVHLRTDSLIDFNWWDGAPFPDLDPDNFSAKWNGAIIPDKSGKYALGAEGINGFRLYFEDSLITRFNSVHETWKRYKYIDLEAGKAYRIKLEFWDYHMDAKIRLIWAYMETDHEMAALEAASNADAVILFMGLSPRLEGEEMDVDVEGFSGGDRVTLGLPAIQERLIKKIHALKKPVILVLLNGSALAVNWEQENIPAIIEAWYPGQASGDAIADVIFGDYNPAGRLPVTFYSSIDQLPAFPDYNMNDRTYRYFKGIPLYPFGFGLSYSTFEYSGMKLSDSIIQQGDTIKAELNVTNTGKIAGDEVVQLYLKDIESSVRIPLLALKGFKRIHLQPGETRQVKFIINPGMMTIVNEQGERLTEPGKYRIYIGGCQPVARSRELGAGNWADAEFNVTR